MSRYARSLGTGRLLKVKRGDGPATFVLDWKGADGRRRRQALSSDRRVAERMRNDIIAQRDLELAGLGSVEGQSRLLSEIRDAYIADLATRASASHMRNVTLRLERLIEGLDAPRVRDIQRHKVIAWRVKRITAGATHISVNKHVSTLRTMLAWAHTNGMIAENPVSGLVPLPITKDQRTRKRRALSEEEIARLLAAADEDDHAVEAYNAAAKTIANRTKGAIWNSRPRVQRVPQMLLWRTFIETGARHSELVHATWHDLDVAQCTLKLRAETTKTGKERIIPLRGDLVQLLWDLRRVHLRVRRRRPLLTDRIFLAPEGNDWKPDGGHALHLFKRVLERAGIAHKNDRGEIVDIHSLRHTCASRLARSRVGLLQAQRILGHADVRMTAQIYTHLGDADLRSAIDMLPPIGGSISAWPTKTALRQSADSATRLDASA